MSVTLNLGKETSADVRTPVPSSLHLLPQSGRPYHKAVDPLSQRLEALGLERFYKIEMGKWTLAIPGQPTLEVVPRICANLEATTKSGSRRLVSAGVNAGMFVISS